MASGVKGAPRPVRGEKGQDSGGAREIGGVVLRRGLLSAPERLTSCSEDAGLPRLSKASRREDTPPNRAHTPT